jgi:hypothetical protein
MLCCGQHNAVLRAKMLPASCGLSGPGLGNKQTVISCRFVSRLGDSDCCTKIILIVMEFLRHCEESISGGSKRISREKLNNL